MLTNHFLQATLPLPTVFPEARKAILMNGVSNPLQVTGLRLRRFLAAAGYCLFLVTGCASLPDAEFHFFTRHDLGSVQLHGARGLLSAQKSAAILEGLRRKVGNIDILQKHMAIEEAIVGTPLSVTNRATLLQDGQATYQAMLAAIRKATNNINMEMYLIEDDEIGRQFADVLLEKQSQGIQVNLIYDSVGSIRTPRAFFKRLTEGGIQVLEFNPVNPLAARKGWQINNRDHRKLLVVDGQIAFLGGVNISSVYSSGSVTVSNTKERTPWRDTQIQIEGPVVSEFQELFIQTWNKQKGEPPVGGNYFPPLKPLGKDLVRAIGSAADDTAGMFYLTLISAITNAEKQVHITNAYFVPDPQLLRALSDAAGRGVDVKLILPGHTDSSLAFYAGRSYYSDLLAAGVKIYERRNALLHAKTVVIDGVWSSVGSSNFDWLSFLHNNEINGVILGPEFARQMEIVFDKDLTESDVIDREKWEHRPLRFRLREAIARLWEYWL